MSYSINDRLYRWSETKNERLKVERRVSFEDVVKAVEDGDLLDVLEHPNQVRYPHQRVFVVEFEGYAYFVPFIEAAECCFLKTIIPSRKATRDYLHKGESDDQAKVDRR
jgi:uncharacterized DUF497 family protein